MRENTEMENSDGFLDKSKKIQKTRILPLRWIGNICSDIAIRSLVKAFDLDEQGNYGYRFKFHSNIWHYFNKPYKKWGTFYTVNIKTKKEK